jgi:hypothetical protein
MMIAPSAMPPTVGQTAPLGLGLTGEVHSAVVNRATDSESKGGVVNADDCRGNCDSLQPIRLPVRCSARSSRPAVSQPYKVVASVCNRLSLSGRALRGHNAGCIDKPSRRCGQSQERCQVSSRVQRQEVAPCGVFDRPRQRRAHRGGGARVREGGGWGGVQGCSAANGLKRSLLCYVVGPTRR